MRCILPCQIEPVLAHQVLDLRRRRCRAASIPTAAPRSCLLHVMRIEADGDQDHVAVGGQRLAVEHHLVVVRRIETQPEMALQRRMALADAVERGDLGDDVAGGVVVADADLVFLRIQIFLAARQGRRLAKLEAGIHAPQAGQRRRQRGANEKAGPTRGLQEIRIDIGRVDEKMRAEEFPDFGGRQLGEIVGELLLGVAPGEVGVGLREADLGQAVHHLRPREGFRQEDHVGMARAHIGDHPFPERQRLGVRIVDAEDAHALARPRTGRCRAARSTGRECGRSP